MKWIGWGGILFFLGHVLPGVACPWEGRPLTQIEIVGLHRTQRSVVIRQLLIQEGRNFNLRDWQTSVQNLKNLGLFRNIETHFNCPTPDQIQVQIGLEEVWTLIPVFQFTRSQRSMRFLLGIKDSNLLGQGLTMGAAYIHFNGFSGARVWFQDPFWLGERQALDAEVLWDVYNQFFYPTFDAKAFELIHHRLSISAQFEREVGWSSSSTWFFRVTGFQDEIRLGEVFFSTGLPPGRIKMWGLQFLTGHQLGRLEVEGAHRYGTFLKNTFAVNLPPWGELSGLPSLWNGLLESEFVTLRRLGHQHQVGVRLKLSFHSPTLYAFDGIHWNGINDVRGVLRDQFRGEFGWIANLEFRPVIWETSWVGIQGALFVDAGMISRQWPWWEFRDAFNHAVLSTGFGLRGYLPQLKDALLRSDFGFLLLPRVQFEIILSLGQMF
jgi:outer membrane protein assembly factor BamA